MAHTTDYSNTSAGKKRKAKRTTKKVVRKASKKRGK